MHTSRVNFYNPISQLVVRLTNPLLQPLRGVLPPTGRIDWAVIVIAVLLQSLILAGSVGCRGPLDITRFTHPAGVGAVGVLGLLVNLYFFILIAMIIVSWVAPGSRHPAIELIWQISEPVMALFAPYAQHGRHRFLPDSIVHWHQRDTDRSQAFSQ